MPMKWWPEKYLKASMTDNRHILQFLDQVAKNDARGSAVYFLGIGGIGMSAIARYFNSRGVRVSGYDKTATVLTRQLEAEGMHIHYEESVQQIDRDAVFTVITPAVPSNHAELQWLKENGSHLLKRSEVLGLITGKAYNICVAGTHGKTTTSTMIAHVLRHSGFGCNAFLGGIASNYNTNFWSSEKNVCVAEADEYDRSFLKLNPDVAIITAMDPDHLDIYGDAAAFTKAFYDFSARIKPNGTLIYKMGLDKEGRFEADNQWSYSREDKNADCYAHNIQTVNGAYAFDVVVKGKNIEQVYLPMGGMHNVENAVACIAATSMAGVADTAIKMALADFKGVHRRFEYKIRNEQTVLIDDYAHHPEELQALLNSAKGLFPDYQCTVVFQPHLYSRTRDFVDGFAAALDLADEVILLPIYPARELPMPGVSSWLIADKMSHDKVTCIEINQLWGMIKMKKENNQPQLIVMAGAGDIDVLVDQVKNILDK